MGSVLSVGALLVTQVAGSPALSGMAATMSTIGAAAAAIPLAALAAPTRPRDRAHDRRAARRRRCGARASSRPSSSALPLLLLAIVFIGVGTAVNLQSRFAATDLSEPHTRGRDIALVVWATTVGAVGGPNLIDLGDAFGQSIGLPPLSGPFIFTIVAQLLAAVVYLVGLRPDPLKLAAELTAAQAEQVDVAVSTHDPAACAPASSRSRSATRPWSASWR